MNSPQYLNFFLAIFLLFIIRPAYFLPIEPANQANDLTARVLNNNDKTDNSDVLEVEKRLTVAESNNSMLNASQPEQSSLTDKQNDTLSVNATEAISNATETKIDRSLNGTTSSTTAATSTTVANEEALPNVTSSTTSTVMAEAKTSINGTLTTATRVAEDKVSQNGTTTTITTTVAEDKVPLNGTMTAGSSSSSTTSTKSESSSSTTTTASDTTAEMTTDDFLPVNDAQDTNLQPNQQDQDGRGEESYQKPDENGDINGKPDWSNQQLKPLEDIPVDNKIEDVPVNNKNIIEPYFDGEDESSWGFLSYFLIFSTLCILVYVAFVNKNKILALILEGKRQTNQRRYNSNVYNRLENVQDVMPNLN